MMLLKLSLLILVIYLFGCVTAKNRLRWFKGQPYRGNLVAASSFQLSLDVSDRRKGCLLDGEEGCCVSSMRQCPPGFDVKYDAKCSSSDQMIAVNSPKILKKFRAIF